ncbi:MAG: LysR family transcriptional regulator [Gemmatales bacterium]|nr:LysR family transcriptional regulator [Gemmatales bacterium]MDW7994117.1 LysR family transcriptional regulator [Gemmatales bacterium]
MHLETLKIFCDVVSWQSFSKAAQVNGVSQSAVSQAIAQLERRLRVQLIDRSSRPLQLTAEGKIFYHGCRELLERFQALERSLRNNSDHLQLPVRVAAIYSVSLRDMSQYVERFRRIDPRANVHIDYLHPDQVYQRVLDGTADLGLVSFPTPGRKLVALPWREEVMVVACAPQHPWAKRREIRIAALQGQPYVHFEKGLVIRRQVDRFLRQHGVSVQVVMEFDNIENIKKAVEAGAGIALLPEPTIRREVQAQTLVAIPLADARLVRPLGIIYRRSPRLSLAAQRFVEVLRQPDDHFTSQPEQPGLPRDASCSQAPSSLVPASISA